jgi:hypothetical protein
MPLGGGDECRVRMLRDSRFEFSCRGDVMGQGRYVVGDDLRLEFLWLAKGSERITTPAPVTMRIAHEGNRLRLEWEGGRRLTWVRRLS